MTIRSDRWHTFPAPRHAVWDAMASVDRFTTWWPWLREFDAVALAVGERWTCTIRAPIRYPVRFTLDLVDIVPAQHVAAVFSGDVEGTAALTLTDPEPGCELHLRCDLHAVRGPAAFVSRWLPGVTRLCHDRVLDVGLRRFRSEVAGRS